MSIVKTAAEIWRKYVIPNVPSSGANLPSKDDIIPWGTNIETLLSGSIAGFVYSSQSALFADLAHVANTSAVVVGDSTVALNGVYMKVGGSGSGSWTRVGDLPYEIITLAVTGGTANAITTNYSPQQPTTPGNKLYLLTPTYNNTAAVTVNGSPVVSNVGSALGADTLVNGSPVLMIWVVNQYQLLVSLPQDRAEVITFTVTGGTADAITASMSSVPSLPQTKLYLLTPTANNTGAALTINGATIKSALDAAPAANALVNGSPVLMTFNGTYYKLLVSLSNDTAGVVAAASASATAAASSATAAASSASALANQVRQYDTRALAIAATIPGGVNYVRLLGYTTAGDGGGGMYVRGIAGDLGAFQDASTSYWKLEFHGTVDLRSLGAGLGSGTADVAAMNAARVLTGATVGVAQGPTIIIPPGTLLDFSTVTAAGFLFTKNGTRIIGGDNRTSVITFNPASPAVLFSFYNAGDLTGGISNCEISNIQIASTNAVQKTAIELKNTSSFLIDKVFTQGITNSGGTSIGISNKGRNLLTVRDTFIYADNPHYMSQNPDRANYGNQDIDYVTFERCQMVCLQTTTAIHQVSDGVNVTNWSDTDSDWAKGRYGVLNVDSASDLTSYTWRFKGIRREQEQGSNPTMFAILRSGFLLRDIIVEGCSTNTQLFNLTGIDRVNFEDVTIFGNTLNIGSADATVARLKWRNLFAQSANTIALTGQKLVRGREKMGGTNTEPIYTDAAYTNGLEGTIEWIGPPSTNGRRVGLWRGTADVPVSTGSNDYQLVPWPLYTVQYAEIRVTSPTVSGVAVFRVGQGPPAGAAVLVGQTNFAVDAASGHLSVYHYSDVNVCIVNKLAGSAPVTVEVLFTI